ncbi:pentapeptide repeat-containing protein [Helicobacter pullorum]|uniref:pentapeptide repeat-containing protein n=1 Tax=Helicobacter pullorum TaxID=35818 RepID=UPI0009818D4E|nr:pentapeptide repeat-containing protein [Helicobacter pullorum]
MLCDFQQEAIFCNSIFNNQKTITFAHITFNKKADFTGATFNQNTEFLDITFKEEANFYMTEFNCDKVTFNITCNKEANFKESFFENSAIFGNCDFKEDLNISIKESKKNEDLNSSIKKDQKIDFEKNTFNTIIIQKEFFSKNVNFKECTFLNKLVLKDYDFNKTTFNTCVFKDNVYFNNSTFKDSADFHECEFEKTASFYGVTFKKTPNFSQAIFKSNLNIANANLNFDFDKLEAKIKQEHNNDNKKSLDKFANDFRDSFRGFKSALIKDNNLLDASEFHKYELYCKELELKHKGKKTLKDKIDYWQLWFYRNLCEHHTDILKSFNSLMLVIGLFSLVSLGVIIGFKYCLGYESIFSHLYMVKDFYNAHIQAFVEIHTLCAVIFNLFILAIYLVILLLSISVKCKYIRGFFIGISYVAVIGILLISPKILIPAMGIFTDKRALLDPLSTLGGIYTICFGFVLFSFIKTIRKNSIVPN